MFAFIADHLGTIIIAAVLAVFAALAIRSIVRSKKKGGCAGCAQSSSGSCPYSNSCHSQPQA